MSYFIYSTEYLKIPGEYECRFAYDAERLMDSYINSSHHTNFQACGHSVLIP